MAYLGAAPDFSASEDGMYVRSVTEDSPAARAGIKTGDVILEIAGEMVANREDLVEVLGANLPGTKVKLKLKRGEETIELELTLGRTQQGR